MNTHIVKTEKMVFGGSCIAYTDGAAVFIPYSLPKETLEISIIKKHKNYSEAKVEKILVPSQQRIEPLCRFFYSCGGCNLQFADDGYQKTLRYAAAVEAFERATKLKSGKDYECTFVSGSDWGYRSRFQFHISAAKRFAQKMQNSNALAEIDDCPVAVPEIRKWLHAGAKNFQSGQRLHIFSSHGKIFTEHNASECFTEILGIKIAFNPLGFFQSNVKMTEKVIAAILKDSVPNGRVLDFYSGVGTFSLFAADYAKEIHLVEHNRHALNYAKMNVSYLNFSSKKCAEFFYHAINGENWIKTESSKLKFDYAFVDPPRSGIDKVSLEWFCRSRIPQLWYISCDPVSFARDTATLLSAGYKIQKYYLFDFYPQTHHIETVCLLVYV